MKIRTVFLCLIGITMLLVTTQCSSASPTSASSTPTVELAAPTTVSDTPTIAPPTATTLPATPTSANTSSDSSGLDGASLVQERCTVCHSIERIQNASKTADEWKTTVERMISHGASLNSEEEAAVIKYLAATYP